MWCYQKPGFEALLLAELQRQQQRSQFCDTLLKAEGVSVPAHSCVLSAISPQVSSALSSTPVPPAGQSRLLEFRALGACTLLHMVRLLYSGEMAGEGEGDKERAVSAAARLGIHGLVEVTRRDRRSRNGEGGGQRAEVGVQTEPAALGESEGRRRGWRREVRDGSTFLWKETPSDVEKDMWTQTEELQTDTAPATRSAASCESTETAAPQGFGQAASHLVLPQIPYVPYVSLVYPPQLNQTPPSASAASVQGCTAAGHTPVAVVAPPYTSVSPSLLPAPSQATPCAAEPQSWWSGPDAEGEEWEDERFARFQGDIPGFISYFLNSDKGEGPRRGRARRRRGAGVAGARRAGTGERRARRPRARAGGRGRGGLMQTVDVQEVGVSKLQKLFLQRWGVRTPRTGQGGGAAGTRLFLKTRELLKPARSCQRRRRRCGQVWEFSQSGDMLPHSEGGEGGGGGGRGGGGNSKRGRKSQTQQLRQDSLLGETAQRAAPISLSPTPLQLYSLRTVPASSSPSPALLPPAAPCMSPAPSLLHTTSLPPPAPPPPEDQPEHIDRLLEEVMMGLNILPNSNSGGARPPPPACSCACSSSGGHLAPNKHQGCAAGVHGSAQGWAVASRASGPESNQAPVLQPQGEGELNEMLDRFLRSFEQHVGSCGARTEKEAGGEGATRAGGPYTALNKYRKSKAQTTDPHLPRPAARPRTTAPSDEGEARTSRSQRRGASVHRAAPRRRAEGAPPRRPSRKRKSRYLPSLEKKGAKPVSASCAATEIPVDRQLQRMPVVKLERRGPLPVRVTLQGHSCQSLDVKKHSPSETQTNFSPVNLARGGLSERNQPVSRLTKTYPIRSRLKEAPAVDSVPPVEEPAVDQPAPRRAAPKKLLQQFLGLSNGGSSTPPVELQPAERRGITDQPKKGREKRERKWTVGPRGEAAGPAGRGRKRRGAASGGEASDGDAAAKRVRSSPTAQPTPEARAPGSEPGLTSERAAAETEDAADAETASQTDVGGCLEQEEKTVRRKTALRETEESLMDEDEDVDVTGGSSPAPDPVTISWTESSGAEEEEGDEDVDVVGEKADCASSVALAALRTGELVDRKYLAEVLGH